MHISWCIFVHISCIFGTAYCCIFRAYFFITLQIMAYLPLCTFKHITHINAHKCIFIIYALRHILKMRICTFFEYLCTWYFLHILAYFQFAYFSIFTLIMPSKANQINRHSNCSWRAILALLLAETCSSLFFLSFSASIVLLRL